MNYKLISMDFDGTLLTSDKKVTQRTKDVLLKYKNNNHIIVGITGRNLSSAKSVLDINIFDYLILCDGAYIYDINNEDIVSSNNINQKRIIDITNYFENIAKRIHYCSMNNYYIYKDRTIDNKDFLIPVKNIEEIKEDIGKINIFLEGNGDKEIKTYKEYIESNFDTLDALVMLDSDDKYEKKWIVVNNKGINKYETLKELCLKLNISVDEVIFFGDSTNDLSIMSRVGIGVAMGNALQEVRNQAKEITLSNDEDGIAVFLENFQECCSIKK